MGCDAIPNEQIYDYIWIDSNINNTENYEYSRDLLTKYRNTKLFSEIEEAIVFFIQIKFRIAFIIISGSLFPEFITKLKGIINEITAVPKIIIFTSESTKPNIENMPIINDSFFNKGGIVLSFNDVLSFLKKNIIKKELNIDRLLTREKTETGAEFSFELLDNRRENIIGILYFARLFNEPTENECKKFDEFLIKNYGDVMEELMFQIYNLKCPISLRIKYWLRAYTLETKFYKDMNEDLMKDKIKPYIAYIQLLYAGLKLNNFNYSYTDNLYRGALIKIEEVEKLCKYMEDRQNSNIPVALIYSKAFMSFSLDINVAMGFMKRKKPSEIEVRVLYILRTDETNDKEKVLMNKNATNADLTDISYFENEKEILLFPFSVYEINDVQKEDDFYIIYLNILVKYKENVDFQFKQQSELINAINQSNYIQMLQEKGLLSTISDFSTIVVHFITPDHENFSLVCKTSDKVSNIMEILLGKFPNLKDKNIILLCNGLVLNSSKTLLQNEVKDDNCVLIFDNTL